MIPINILFNIPAATDPLEVATIMDDAGYRAEIPPNGILPASKTNGGKNIVHAIISGATYQQILDVTTAQRPVWQIFGAQDMNPTPNPAFDPEIPESEPTIIVVHKVINNSVWNFLPDVPDGLGGFVPQTEIHIFQGSGKWPSK